MSTVGQVVDRLYREYLDLSDDQPVQAPLSASADSSTTSWYLDSSGLDPDEADVFVEGMLVECGLELALVVAVDDSNYPTSLVLTVRRGMSGTTAASHDAGANVLAAPTFPRLSVFEAVADNVTALYPQLYRVATEDITTAGYVSVPASVVDPLHFTWVSGSRIHRANVELFTDLPAAVSATGKAVRVVAVGTGRSGTLTFRASFDRPTSESDDLAAFGVDGSWERIVVVGSAAQVLAGRELDQVTQEFVTEQVRGQGYPVESASRQRNELIRLYQLMIQQAQSRLMAERDELVSMTMPTFGVL